MKEAKVGDCDEHQENDREKVILSPLDSREAERLVHWINDLEVTLGTTLAASNITLEKESEILKQMEQGGRDFLIIARDSKQPIGTCGTQTGIRLTSGPAWES